MVYAVSAPSLSVMSGRKLTLSEIRCIIFKMALFFENEMELQDFIANDPAGKINHYEYFPMKAVVPEIPAK